MLRAVKPENLGTYLRQISTTFPDLDLERSVSNEDIRRYYRESYWGYALFHSWGGAIHMALSQGNRFSKNDYFRQAEEVRDDLERRGEVDMVCELGCGRGFNLGFLARQMGRTRFVGVDLSERNLQSARTAFSDVANLSFIHGDFQSLPQLLSATADYLFAVESICHATDLDVTLRAASSTLVDGGRFRIYDGFRGEQEIHDDDVRRAVRLSERAMAVPHFRKESEFRLSAEGAGFSVVSVTDRSNEIMPNLIRLSDFAKSFFKLRPVAAGLKKVLPDGLVKNAIAGLLMAVTLQTGAHRYLCIDLEKIG